MKWLRKHFRKLSRKKAAKHSSVCHSSASCSQIAVPDHAESSDEYFTASEDEMEEEKKPVRARRKSIPYQLKAGLEVWSFLSKCIGTELSKIPMPVNFNEPLSVLQRLTENLEYANLLSHAAKQDSLRQLSIVAAFVISNYSTTAVRTTKPFNPLLGETYEFDRTEDLGWRSIAEQVSHHPPISSHFAEGQGWHLQQDFSTTSKVQLPSLSRFCGVHLLIVPCGQTHIVFDDGNHYVFSKVNMMVQNLMFGGLWLNNFGELKIENRKTGDNCILVFEDRKSQKEEKKVSGTVYDAKGKVHYNLQGIWDSHVDLTKANEQGDAARIWSANPLPPHFEEMYNFTQFAIELNEREFDVAPTDSRLRPDQRLMEDGNWHDADIVKAELENRQRCRIKEMGGEETWSPRWFEKYTDPVTQNSCYKFTGNYWTAKTKKDWSNCPQIYFSR